MENEAIDTVDSPMQRCVDVGDIDGLLALVSADEIAIAWHRYTATPEPKDVDHPDWWAVDLFWVTELLERKDLHRHLLLKLIEHASEATLGQVAAGPLEDFVSDDEDDVRWIEAACATNMRLRTALTFTWSSTYVSRATLRRLDAAAGEPLPRLSPGASGRVS
ncbi:MAG: hypothetical protein U0P45_01885 [Acidimicrobiales bacterium]